MPEVITDISYDGQRSKLLVAFDDGGRYVYVGVPGEVHRSFVEAPSRDTFFVLEIRDRYPFNRLNA
jgi:lysyl-tRNA synthetase class 2